MVTPHLALCALTACLMLPGAVLADLTVRPDGTVAVDRVRAEPPRGLSRKQVLKRIGAPRLTAGPVGDPPISRWDYPGFSVYFEGGHVLHTVVHRP